MSSDVVLTAAMRNNLLSLQSTQRLIDTTQLRLATGLKVNSALDNPQNFFASQALSNRASDLGRLLDGISQSIRTIEEADKGVTALNSLLEQASAIVQSARDELAASEGEARAIGEVDLRDITNLTAAVGAGGLGIANGTTFNVVTVNDEGDQISETITISTGDTAQGLAARITDVFKDDHGGEITASVTAEGYFSIQSSDGRSFRIVSAGATPATNANWTALGMGDYFEDEDSGGATRAAATIVAGNTLSSISLYENAGDVVEAGDAIAGATFQDAAGNDVLEGFAVGDTIRFDVNTDTTNYNVTVTLAAGTTWQDVVDTINNHVDVGDYIEASFNSKTGQINFSSLSDQVNTFGITTDAAAAASFDIGLGDPTGEMDPVTMAGGNAEERVYSFNSSTEALDNLAKDYNSLREQIDTLVNDAQYRGVNLLNGDNLVTYFNENNSSSLTTEGQIFTADGLGVNAASFRSSAEIEESAVQARDALAAVRSFGSSLANNLSVIQTRREFTEGTIVTLNAGASDLTRADENEEGANLLALQTRQQLGVTSLSLASQSQQSVLRLF